MKLGIDLDDVCFDFMAGFKIIHGLPTFPKKSKLDEMYPNLFLDDILETIYGEQVYRISPPIINASRCLKLLVQDRFAEIEYVSARPEGLMDLTRDLLWENDFPSPRNVVLTTNNDGKIAYICAQDFDIVLDDRIEIVSNIGHKVERPYLFSQPWNWDSEWKFRATGWNAFYKAIVS